MGDVNRRIARGLYERASKSEKKEAREFFEKLNPTRNGKVNVVELLERSVGVGSNENLDLDGDGFLDFEDVLVLFYYSIKREINILRCGRCSKLMFGPSFSCFHCFFKSAHQRFALCRDCYATGKVDHGHPLTSTAESLHLHHRDQALLLKLSDLISAHHPSTSPTKELKELWEKEKKSASPALVALADNYFKSMGPNNELDIKKFSTLTKQQEQFLTPTPHSIPATNYMKNVLEMKLSQHNGAQPTPTAAASTLQTYNSNYRPNPAETSSYGISPLKVATTTFKIVEMALTIGSISSMCIIM
ncbi:uncharacterized protein LOC125195369 [Salvia hispanica]|uniref:uncharacterized protein LOC125195369 n=1 Tax=Salvia hispanica TaxID=49212 RepID=UPI002009D2D7|nr:uncharacterized protein LOC125195369 [Salvia hispanica]